MSSYKFPLGETTYSEQIELRNVIHTNYTSTKLIIYIIGFFCDFTYHYLALNTDCYCKRTDFTVDFCSGLWRLI